MSYLYDKLSPEERERVLCRRRMLGYPLHGPPHPFRGPGCDLITGVNFEHRHIMSTAERRTEFEARLLECWRQIEAGIWGWVVLPNHHHSLLSVSTLDSLSLTIKQLHGTTAREWNLEDGPVGKRRVWYRFTDRKIRNEDHFYRALNYIHFNPVKHGYVTSVYDWPWSSVHGYLDAQGREWLRETWRNHPPDRMGRGWDD